MKYSYNKNQRDALILNFILVKNSTCFEQIYCPSSGVLILYSQQQVFVILVMLTLCQQSQDNLSETCRVLYQNKVEKQCISLSFIIRISYSLETHNISTKAHILEERHQNAIVILVLKRSKTMQNIRKYFELYERNGKAAS